MNIRSIALAAAALTLASPAIWAATPEKNAMNACARAFASSLAAPGAAAPAYTVSYVASTPSTISEFYPHEYTFHMQANQKSRGEIARATCSADRRGGVVLSQPQRL